MLGMVADGEGQLARDMVDNFAELIDSLGFIPNGNRTYYVGRSQPPFFSLMVDVIARTEGKVFILSIWMKCRKNMISG